MFKIIVIETNEYSRIKTSTLTEMKNNTAISRPYHKTLYIHFLFFPTNIRRVLEKSGRLSNIASRPSQNKTFAHRIEILMASTKIDSQLKRLGCPKLAGRRKLESGRPIPSNKAQCLVSMCSRSSYHNLNG